MDAEAAYAGRPMMQELRQKLPQWERDAAAYREASAPLAQLDVAYGPGQRQRLDVFLPRSSRATAVALFVHGGYWQATGKSWFSHLARGANAHGVTVVMAGYTLCPEATIEAIVEEVRAAVAFSAKRFGRPVVVFGHSAGGHLAACMLATDWSSVDLSLPRDAVPAAMPISGVFELEPLVTTSVNRKLGLDAAEARRLSPATWPFDRGRRAVAYVGGAESTEFLRQTRQMVDRWTSAGVAARAVEAPRQSHFEVIEPLADADSPMTADLVSLVSEAGGGSP